MFKHLLMEQAGGNDGGTGGSGGGAGGAGPAANIADGGNGAGAGGGSVGDGGGGGGTGGGDGGGWLAALPDDIKADPSLAVFKDVAGLARSFVSAQKMIGADKVIIPNEKSTEEDWNAFFKKTGRPETAEKYEFTLPHGQKLDEEFAKGFKDAAFKSGLSAKQVAGLATWYGNATKAAQDAAHTAQVNELRDTLATYKTNLGGDEKYMARVDDARVAVNALAKPELKEFLKTSGLGSRPEMIEFFAELKGMMSEDKIRDGTGVSFSQGDDPAMLQREIDEIETKLFTGLDSPNRMAWVEQRSKLYERLSAARQRTA